jgi:hypothetical protein
MDPTEGSETSSNINQTLGIHPKVETVNTEHSESLKSKKHTYFIGRYGLFTSNNTALLLCVYNQYSKWPLTL